MKGFSLKGRCGGLRAGRARKGSDPVTDLSMIVPAYNEAQRIGATLTALESYCARKARERVQTEVIVVCDGCRDKTREVVETFLGRLPLRVIHYAVNRGKGYAVRRGIAESLGEVVLFLDADGSTPVGEIDRLALPVRRGLTDVVIGSRRTPDARIGAAQPWFRRVLGGFFAWHTRKLLGLTVKDTQCGFKVFGGAFARDLFSRLTCDGFAFDLELLVEAREQGACVWECGVMWREKAGSTVRPLRDGLRMLRTAWSLRFRYPPQPAHPANRLWAIRRLAPATGHSEGQQT